MTSKVSILLSTYNGATYLSEQLESLLNQNYTNININIRDDGSTDDSQQILEQYAAKYTYFKVKYGNNIGASKSFFSLLSQPDECSCYFAFCDQDDVWYKNKIDRAVKMLSRSPPDSPALYCSRLHYVNRDLTPLAKSRLPHRGMSFQNALVENTAIGCTIVINRPARSLILNNLPVNDVAHDWWCYLVVSAFGTILYDADPTIDYRLHNQNTVGAATSVRNQLLRRVKRFIQNGRHTLSIHDQAIEFLTCFSSMIPPRKLQTLTRLIEPKDSFIKRLGTALSLDVYRQSRIDDLLLRILFILGWY